MLAPDGACVSTEATFGAGAADIPEHAAGTASTSTSTTPRRARRAAAPGRRRTSASGTCRSTGSGTTAREGRRADRTLIVAGLATVALGVLLLLDRTGAIDVQFNYMVPAVLAAIGAVLLSAGLSE